MRRNWAEQSCYVIALSRQMVKHALTTWCTTLMFGKILVSLLILVSLCNIFYYKYCTCPTMVTFKHKLGIWKADICYDTLHCLVATLNHISSFIWLLCFHTTIMCSTVKYALLRTSQKLVWINFILLHMFCHFMSLRYSSSTWVIRDSH